MKCYDTLLNSIQINMHSISNIMKPYKVILIVM